MANKQTINSFYKGQQVYIRVYNKLELATILAVKNKFIHVKCNDNDDTIYKFKLDKNTGTFQDSNYFEIYRSKEERNDQVKAYENKTQGEN